MMWLAFPLGNITYICTPLTKIWFAIQRMKKQQQNLKVWQIRNGWHIQCPTFCLTLCSVLKAINQIKNENGSAVFNWSMPFSEIQQQKFSTQCVLFWFFQLNPWTQNVWFKREKLQFQWFGKFLWCSKNSNWAVHGLSFFATNSSFQICQLAKRQKWTFHCIHFASFFEGTKWFLLLCWKNKWPHHFHEWVRSREMQVANASHFMCNQVVQFSSLSWHWMAFGLSSWQNVFLFVVGSLFNN